MRATFGMFFESLFQIFFLFLERSVLPEEYLPKRSLPNAKGVFSVE